MHSRNLVTVSHAPVNENEWLDRRAARPDSLTADVSQLWPELVAGKKVILECASVESQGFLALGDVAPEARTRIMSDRAVEILERVLLGDAQKVIACDLAVSCSTIADTTRTALQCMGLRCVGSRAPFILCFLVFAHQNAEEQGLTGALRIVRVASNLTFVMLRQPNRLIADKVSRAEIDVLQMRAEGMSHAEIAKRRKTSVRTIANQLASAWEKLGISGRNELIRYLLHAN